MDEPFGAIDPITRDRLQGEFLRLQREVRKTVVFVTHDIEEAVQAGGPHRHHGRRAAQLEQYDTPARILGRPASAFVADFVGADRGLQAPRRSPQVDRGGPRDAAGRRTRRDRWPTPAGAWTAEAGQWAVVVDGTGTLRGWIGSGRHRPATAPSASGPAPHARRGCRWRLSLKQAFSEMLQHDAGWVAVLDGDRFVGVLTPEVAARRPAPVRRRGRRTVAPVLRTWRSPRRLPEAPVAGRADRAGRGWRWRPAGRGAAPRGAATEPSGWR